MRMVIIIIIYIYIIIITLIIIIVYLVHQAHCKCKKLYSVTVSGEMTVTKGRRPPTFLSHTQASHVHARTIVYFHTIDAECHSLNLAALLTWLMHNNA